MLAQIKIQSLSNDTHSELDSDSSALDNNFMMGTGCKRGKKAKMAITFYRTCPKLSTNCLLSYMDITKGDVALSVILYVLL